MTAAATALVAVTSLAVVPAAAADDAVPPSLMVTEIVPNTAGADEFEFFEVTNTADVPIDLDAAGVSLQYFGASSPVDLDIPEGISLAAGESVAFWVSYTTADGTLDSFAYDEADFRATFAALGASTGDYQVIRATGQAGMANGGGRGIRVLDGTGATISEATYSADDVSTDTSAVFGVADDVASPTLEIRQSRAVPSPGVADASLLEPVPAPSIPAITVADDVAAEWPVVVSEIMANHSGADTYEYVEVANLTDEDIDLADAGYSLEYYGAGSAVGLTMVGDTIVPAGRAVVLWNIGDDAATDLTEEQFRSYYGLSDEVLVAQVYGQGAFANGGERGIRLLDAAGTVVADAYYGAADVGNDLSAHFGVPSIIGETAQPVTTSAGAPTPGVLDASAYDVTLSRATDPDLTTSLLQVTELLPDSGNVNSADGYEFIEVYNPTDAPVAWEDISARYNYLDVNGAITSSTLWPTDVRAGSVPAGGTVVLWIKNGGNTALTAADFNAYFGTELIENESLFEITVGGMANGGRRSIELLTNTGVSINAAEYNDSGDDTLPDQGIQYGVAADGVDALQVKLGTAAASPGVVTSDQVHDGLAAAPAAGNAPVIADLTGPTFTPGEALTVQAAITDDVSVRTATLTLRSAADGVDVEYNLTPGEDGTYSVEIPAADTIGKREFTYRFTASDGFHAVTTAEATIDTNTEVNPLRLNVADGDYVSGTTVVSASGDDVSDTLALSVDGAEVETFAELEDAPVFAFEATATDAFFRNGVVMDGEELLIFSEGYYAREVTVATELPLDKVNPGESFSVRIYAGTKAAPEIDLNENNDNFNVSNLRLILPDGRTLRPQEAYDPDAWIYLGDSGTAVDYLEATFVAPDDAFTGHAYAWDTTTVDDGDHTVAAVDGDDSAEATVTVDNTAPTVTSTVTSGEVVHGERELDADIVDAGSGLASTEARLDGRRIYFPETVSSLDEDQAGDHTLAITATDEVGNTTEVTLPFTIPVENPEITALAPGDGETATGSVPLTATVTDPTDDSLAVEFFQGNELEVGDESTVSTGEATVALDVARTEATEISAADAEAIATLDGDAMTTASDAKLPYVLLEAEVGDQDGDVRLRWDGQANADAKVLLYVLDPALQEWVEIDRVVTDPDEGELADVVLEGVVATSDYSQDGIVTALVQHSEGYAGDDQSTRESIIEPNHPEDTPRDEYDFTLAWESDTQYYNQDNVSGYENIYDRQLSIHEYLLEVREDINLQYLAHNGDIVNVSSAQDQWERADEAYAMLDDAGLPYGVLAGNHDVYQATNDYTDYSTWFGASRYEDNPWWGGDHLDNRGHYDLITAGGIDFLFLYMGWGPEDEQIDWMNEVLAQYPERVAFVQLHEFMLTTGGLGPVPQRIMDEVVATNANVRAVTSGHYHDAYTRYDSFDDDGDGVDDRTVTSMLFDYQGLPNGGEGYMRLLHFDNESETLHVRTYSDYLEDYNAEDSTLEDEHQDFTVSYDTLGIDVRTKVLATDSFRADALSDESIASFEGVASGATVSTGWEPGEGTHSWFMVASDEHGGSTVSEVREVTVTADDGDGSGDGSGNGSGSGSSDGSGTGGSGGSGNASGGGTGDGSSGADSSGDDEPADSATLSLDVDRVGVGGTLRVEGGGFAPGERVVFTLHSDPIVLGAVTADADGAVAVTLAIPTDAPLGEHTLVAEGATSGISGSATLVVTAADGSLPTTGPSDAWITAAVAAALLVALGAGLGWRSRRRAL
ncbi:lamin tail domain-containing protein [Demequina sp. NBRC 110057]|uniref:lamin tail domain-containing protein n=1 Tax=Demequina sp. NBRC 110057 TaxID=1570346 RepID=UPI0009FEF2E3|nr:lamin tail domain-containing protein [Demequina sp. NBRC 110057]